MQSQPTLETPRLRVVPVSPAHAQAMLDYQLRNRAHLAPWDPTPGPQFFTLPFWIGRGKQRALDWQEGRGAAFLLTDKQVPQLVIGTATLSQIQRGVGQYAMLGYGLDKAYQGQGVMYEALRAVVAFAFDGLRLHRLQANYQPDNQRSAALLARLGFVIEGRADQYLFLNGAWRDHVMTSLTNPHFNDANML
ncbi:GNAT family N-acetyltransferase [Paludibacterium sp.]|uniref:GNAT family N-acetyltransferase n=1 Tax=Paludibacterium sp. TaxID=1917523 RepID=UPI0025EE2BB4|nr:GNAT family N-acetyltransferase [Paludibacterium sp.]